jgi:uncharacterized membrane protein YbhN (UPF0104 family)
MFSFMYLGILIGIVYYLSINANKYLSLLKISYMGVIAIFALSLAIPIINGLINVYMFKSLNINLSFREGFYLAASATLANQLPLPGGIVARGVYLKRKHGLAYTQYFSASLALFFCSVAVNGVVGTVILLYWTLMKHTAVSHVLLFGFIGMAACVLIFLLPFAQVRLPGRIGEWLTQALKGWYVISHNSTLLIKVLGLQIGFMFLFAIRQFLAFNMLSQNMTISQAILLSSGAILTQLVSFAPGGLGVREVIVGSIASILGYDLTVSIAAVELDRVISTLTIVVIGWVSTVILGKQFLDGQSSR